MISCRSWRRIWRHTINCLRNFWFFSLSSSLSFFIYQTISLFLTRGRRTISKLFLFAEGEYITQSTVQFDACFVASDSYLRKHSLENLICHARPPRAFRSIPGGEVVCVKLPTYVRHARLRIRGVCLVVTWRDFDITRCVCIPHPLAHEFSPLVSVKVKKPEILLYRVLR